MAKINLYLNFNGNTEEVFNYYRSIFGGEFVDLQRLKDTPGVENLSAVNREKLMHISLPLGENLVLHATDALESMGHSLVIGNNVHIMIDAKSKEEAESYFNKLSAGGKVEIPLQDMFWGAYYGAFTDQYGIQWMVNYDYRPK